MHFQHVDPLAQRRIGQRVVAAVGEVVAQRAADLTTIEAKSAAHFLQTAVPARRQQDSASKHPGQAAGPLQAGGFLHHPPR
ncbi:hypothetical protein [Burkholderia ubonensis]|uniref:hypothetical protein n=1 Tax=Burkholderia ubonensis TaxID=101571 RepID=UPI0012F945F2|nr:hypothetical protein [Burkholderia ubonensis]